MSCNVCSDFRSWSHGGAQNQAKNQGVKADLPGGKGSTDPATLQATKQNVNQTSPGASKIECPPGYKELANSTWAFLHTTAAYYPEKPTGQQRNSMRNLISSVSVLYPCQPCAEHMREEMVTSPPKVDSQSDISLWLCQFHNSVNKVLGKPVFDCSKTNERWRDGPKDGSCN
ncbi:Flavin-linked sulfhydryl oxidase of the mitochondrial IMS [Entomophthora muscae]|uniref:Flavin-linked sulfhydryl oxidase of the mitochondrial IMS n=1 Tax=Entomophthora muscae TaxID=34485 RepID=A0ACC2SIM4_9FUNG|nr:Flavin-linked sulfhydryl oxidase of the mitochondrial IMS [Entomophthora muscae]